jgi:hypothetical protein
MARHGERENLNKAKNNNGATQVVGEILMRGYE